MKIVYALVSNEADTYYEQMLISIISLQRVMPNAEVSVIVDQSTFETFQGNRARIHAMDVNIISVELPREMTPKDRSRFLKTTMRSHIDGSFLYIDGDTVVCRPLDDLDQTLTIACVKDKHYFYSGHPLKYRIDERAKKCGYRSAFHDIHYNGGFMWVGDDPKTYAFFQLWHELWKQGLEHGVTQDQASLNEANIRMDGIITELDGTWNCQLSTRTGAMPYIHAARMLHYFASNSNSGVPYDLGDKQIQKSVLCGDDTKLQWILDHPKSAFSVVQTLVHDAQEADILESHLFAWIRRLYQNHRRLFDCLNFMARAWNAIVKRLK